MDNYDYVYMSGQSDYITIEQLQKQVQRLQEALYLVEAERDRLRAELESLKAQGPCRS